MRQHARLHAAHCTCGAYVLHPFMGHSISIVYETGNSFDELVL